MSPLDVPYIPDALVRPQPVRRAALLSELRQHPVPRRHRRRLALAAVAAAIALAALVPALRDGGATPALAVTRAGDTLELRIQDAGASGEELTRDLQAAGIDGEVRVIPVPPEMVGTWLVIEEASKRPAFDPKRPPQEQLGPEETVRLDRIEFGRHVLRLPISQVRESSGHFILWAGREARAGEDVAASRGAFQGWFNAMLERERHPTP
jgi:hypothetical protein